MPLVYTLQEHTSAQDRSPYFVCEDGPQITPHDKLFKQLIHDFFEQFIEVFFPEFQQEIDFDTVKFLSGEMLADVFEGRHRDLDIVIEAKWKSTDSIIIIHIEPQSYEQQEFNKRMYHYHSLLYGKFEKPIIPIALFTYDAPRYNESFTIKFLDKKIVQFQYLPIHLRELNWRDFMRKENPVSAVLLSKMGYSESEKVQVKLEFLRIISKLKLKRSEQTFLYRFFEVYLKLSSKEEGELMTKIERDEDTFDISSLPISFVERGKRIGREEGRVEGRVEGRKEGIIENQERIAIKMLQEKLPIDLIVKLTELDKKRINELKKKS